VCACDVFVRSCLRLLLFVVAHAPQIYEFNGLHILEIKRADDADQDTYTCTVTNELGTAICQADLAVFGESRVKTAFSRRSVERSAVDPGTFLVTSRQQPSSVSRRESEIRCELCRVKTELRRSYVVTYLCMLLCDDNGHK
jgi:hypothetical protein